MNTKPFIKTALDSVAYDHIAKKRFHMQAAKVLRALAKAIGYTSADYDLRHNQGGIAVSGEITLHSDTLYVQFSQSVMGTSYGFMWRSCKGRKDYGGGPNQWMKWEHLEDLEVVAATMRRYLSGSYK